MEYRKINWKAQCSVETLARRRKAENVTLNQQITNQLQAISALLRNKEKTKTFPRQTHTLPRRGRNGMPVGRKTDAALRRAKNSCAKKSGLISRLISVPRCSSHAARICFGILYFAAYVCSVCVLWYKVNAYISFPRPTLAEWAFKQRAKSTSLKFMFRCQLNEVGFL